MSTRLGTRRTVLLMLSLSLMMTVAISVLVTNDLISPEWFFGGPAVGTVAASAAFAGRFRTYTSPGPRSVEAAEAFQVIRGEMETERAIAGRLRRDIEETLSLLGGDTLAAVYLGENRLTRRLHAMEEQRARADQRADELMRAQAGAHARLVIAAHEMGVPEPESRSDEDLVQGVLRSPKEPTSKRG